MMVHTPSCIISVYFMPLPSGTYLLRAAARRSSDANPRFKGFGAHLRGSI